jgi:hypothetical protein
MKALGIAPPLSSEVVVAGVNRLTNAEANVVQLDVGVSVAAADIKHE